jgi:acyl-homoserine-lactone acylase
MCVLLASCGGGGSDGDTTFQAEIRRTTGGVPHVKANDYAGAGFGLGYVWAEDHACAMSGRWLTVGAEVAKRYGANGRDFPFDARDGNLASDLYFQKLIDEGWLDKRLQDSGPTGVLPEVRELVKGYVAGYNQHLKEVNNVLNDPRCAGADWIRPITERDLYFNATFWADMLTAVRSEFAGFLAAVPPTVTPSAVNRVAALEADKVAPPVTASNMIALGREATQSGNGMVFSNPHWEWQTADAMVAAHLTIPGKLNVNGMTFGASPVIGIGHNDKVGWAATSAAGSVTSGVRYRLNLVPGSPTSYLVDGVRHEMVPRTVTVQVLNASNVVEPYTHTFYETMFGMVSASAARPWTAQNAYTLKHSPLKLSGLNMWHLYSQAKSVEDIHAADRATMGVAWINSAAADSTGRAYRSVPTPLPYVTNDMLTACTVATGILDGTRAACAPLVDPEAPFPGVFPPSKMPYQFRFDYTFNANGSHWLTNPRQPLTGYPTLFGPERTRHNQRTHAGIQIIEQRLDGSDGLPGKGFTLEQFIAKTFDGRDYFAQLWKPELVAFCDQVKGQAGAPARMAEGCTALAAWRGTYSLDDPGAVLYRRFAERAGANAPQPPLTLFTTTFDPANPLSTPNGLNETNAVRDALYGALGDLVDNGIPINASMRGYQYGLFGTEKIPLPGGVPNFQALYVDAFQGANGWANTGVGGSSFVYWVELKPDGPVGKQIQVQGQSSSAGSPYYAVQTRLYSEGKYLDIRFTEAQIAADPNMTVKAVRGNP